jgi:hypothetical protein
MKYVYMLYIEGTITIYDNADAAMDDCWAYAHSVFKDNVKSHLFTGDARYIVAFGDEQGDINLDEGPPIHVVQKDVVVGSRL